MGRTWGEDVAQYHASKQQLGFVPEPVFRHTRDKSVLWRSQDRVYDPILQVLRDPDAEAQRREFEETRKVDKLQAAFTRTMRYETQYNILTAEDRRPMTSTSAMSSSAGAFGDSAPPGALSATNRTASTSKLVGRRVQQIQNSIPLHATGKRTYVSKAPTDFNILNNMYKEDHESKAAADDQLCKETLERKFWATHTFDPLVQKFYSPEKDAAATAADEAKIADTVRFKQMRVPPTLQASEGHAYDITSFAVRNEEKMETVMAKTNRTVAAIQRLRGTADMRRTMADDRYQRDLDRALARAAKSEPRLREFEEVGRTYDIVSNQEYFGVGSRQPDYVKTALIQRDAVKKPSAFDVLSTQKLDANTFTVNVAQEREWERGLDGSGALPSLRKTGLVRSSGFSR
jgi:hypothetical protein